MNDRQYYRAKLKEAVEGILSGKLKHDQEFFHCRSAHCVIGWYEMLTLDEHQYYEKDFSTFGVHLNRLSPFESLLYKKISKETGYSKKDIINLAKATNKKKDIKKIWESMN